MKILIILIFVCVNQLYSKTIYLDEFSKGKIYVKDNFITSLTFVEEIKTLFLGDTQNFKAEISGDKKILALWNIGNTNSTNLIVKTEKDQFNFLLKKHSSSPLNYFIKTKNIISKNEIIKRSLIKDKDYIESLASYPINKNIKLKFHDKESFKDTLYINIRIKINYTGKKTIKIIPESIVLSQSNKLMPIIFKHFNKSTNILTLTGEERKIKGKIRAQIPFNKEGEICRSEIYI